MMYNILVMLRWTSWFYDIFFLYSGWVSSNIKAKREVFALVVLLVRFVHQYDTHSSIMMHMFQCVKLVSVCPVLLLLCLAWNALTDTHKYIYIYIYMYVNTHVTLVLHWPQHITYDLSYISAIVFIKVPFRGNLVIFQTIYLSTEM